jgi:acyl-CoA synthetase (AMP-forming)/AMP-acid ligase II/thioesterase domain-containing protein
MHPLAEILDIHAAHAPGAPALLAPDRAPLSYSALWTQTQLHLRQLRALGILESDCVAIVLPNGPDMAAAFLSVACSCASAPLNPGYTRDDFHFYYSSLPARAVLLSAESPAAALDAARELGIAIITLTPSDAAGAFSLSPGAPTGPIPDWPSPQSAALLLHTSGTTARPKLVPLSAANLACSARAIAQTLALTPQDRCLNIMPLFHIHGLAAALLATLTAQGSVVCSSGLYGQHFFTWLKDFQPTWYTAVPTMHQAILSRARELGEVPRRANLRFIRSSSASLPPVVLDGIEAVFGAPMLEAYGMTEASHQMTSNPLPPLVHKPGSVGLPAGPEVAVIDPSGALLPRGETGEVVIRGPQVTAGYVSNPLANESAFTNGWFRTGDQGRFDADGYLFLTGRLKELINRGGEKISPREIDEVLLSHGDVQQAVAFAIPHAQLGEEIGAAVELRANAGPIDAEALRSFAARRLPPFKVPRIIRIVPSIPKGPTGKLQRIGLARQLGIEPLDDRQLGDYAPPEPGLEQRIAALWLQLLPAARCGRHDRFEALGGDSLLAARMLASLSQSEHVDVPFEAFVTHGTIASLASSISTQLPPASTLFQLLRGSETPHSLFCFPGHDATLLGLSRMAQHLDAGLAVYGLNLQHCDPAATLDEHARACLDELLRLCPRGPFRLAGVCLGGCLAYAVAQLLVAHGRQVSTLALIDTINPAWGATQPWPSILAARSRQWRHKLIHHYSHLGRVGPIQGLHYLAGRVNALVRNNAETAAARLSLPIAAPSFRRALLSYRPEPLPVDTLVIRFHGRRLDAPALGWQPLLGGHLRLVDLPLEPEGALANHSALRVASVLNAHHRASTPL